MEERIKGQTGGIDGHSETFGQMDLGGRVGKQNYAILTSLECSFLSTSRHPGSEARRGLGCGSVGA